MFRTNNSPRVAPQFSSVSERGGMVRALDPLQVPDWDQQVLALPGSTIFHGTAWARVLAETYGFKPVCLVAGQPGRIHSLLPFMEVGSWLTGWRGVSLPFTDQVASLVSEPAWHGCLVAEATVYGRNHGWRTWECRGGAKPTPEASPSLRFYRHELDLSPGEAALFAQLDSSVRRAIRKSERSEVTVEVSTAAAVMEEYFALHCLTRRKHGLPPQPIAFFRSLHRQIIAPGHGRVFLAHYQGRAVAALVFLQWGRGAMYKFGASDETFQELRATNRVMWEAIRAYANEGFASVDFGRTSLENTGLRRFKQGWGSVESEFSCFKYDLRQNRFVVERDRVAGWYNSVFRRLPLSVLRTVGACLYPHLA